MSDRLKRSAGNLPASPAGSCRERGAHDRCRRGRLRYVLLAVAVVFAACTNPEPVEVEEKPDMWHPREAQSDFLDIGEQAGIEWLSFVPQDQQKYPELFEGLDKDQKNRVRLAPRESNERVLLHFDLPEGSKLWPVDWYGTELMAIDLERMRGFSLALSPDGDPTDIVERICERRLQSFGGRKRLTGGGTEAPRTNESVDYSKIYKATADGEPEFLYMSRRIQGRTATFVLVLEWCSEDVQLAPDIDQPTKRASCVDILEGISIKRELALEGSPKHKVSSSLDELLGGTMRFPEGTLKLPIQDGYLVRKTGGDSTIQIDGEGAEPWILIRRLDETESEGDLRVRVRNDVTFRRRLKVTSADFGRGRVPEDAKLPIVAWDYSDSDADNVVLGIMKVGNEILEFEILSTGLRDGDQRRAARAAAMKLLAGATSDTPTEAPEFEPLAGWNIGTMGREE